ncbi:MAG TPA: L-aspartate oxidase [Spirochaetia bacterium]|nr:L-aspartate oxidase [Spirochaetia bacterium]
MEDRREFDLVILGSGIAGLTAALAAAEQGRQVALVTKEPALSECNTRYAQGGIVARGIDDSAELLANDITVAGDGINSRDAVDLLAAEGPALVDDLLVGKLAVPFTREADGSVGRTREAVHSVRRIYYAKDTTGLAIETSLVAAVEQESRIERFTEHVAIDLITNTHNSTDTQERYRRTRVIGVYLWARSVSMVRIFFAPSVIIATGGVGNLFQHTSNPPGATGDGIAMASRIGAEIINAEYVQFHPTVLHHRDVKRFLISEAVRGEGAKLVNHAGEQFMKRYEPERADLAPRDEVSRAMYREMENEGSEYLYLDARSISEPLPERFPGIFEQCMAVGLDIRKEPIPVVPAAHYFCGGIKVNLQGRASVAGLYAVGEASCTGVHGANRLASVSLLEGLYFGKVAGLDAAKNATPISERLRKSIPSWVNPSQAEDFDPVLIQQDMLSIQSTLWNYAGVIRTQKRLVRALADLNYLSHRVEQFYRAAAISRPLVELRNATVVARLIVSAAFSNGKSLGCHFVEP